MPRTAIADCQICGAEDCKRRQCGQCLVRMCKSCWKWKPCPKFAGGHRASIVAGSRVKRIRRVR